VVKEEEKPSIDEKYAAEKLRYSAKGIEDLRKNATRAF